jgi:hypothetical protein
MSPIRFLLARRRYLDPATVLGEILFGMIMTLTFTLAASIVVDERLPGASRQMLIAVIGCNLAWGLIDGAIHVLSQVFGRSRLRLLGGSIRRAPTEVDAAEVISEELDDLLRGVTGAADRMALYLRIAANVRSMPPQIDRSITKHDLVGGAMTFWIVLASSIPAALPFLLIEDVRSAVRVSIGVLLTLLFATGYSFAQHIRWGSPDNGRST